MVKLFLHGEPFYMSILTVLLLVILFLSLFRLHKISFQIKRILSKTERLRLIRAIGLFSLVFGVFSQFLGLFGALEAIEVWGNIEAEMLFNGIQVSFIPMCYGLIIFALSRVLSGGIFKKARLNAL